MCYLYLITINVDPSYSIIKLNILIIIKKKPNSFVVISKKLTVIVFAV